MKGLGKVIVLKSTIDIKWINIVFLCSQLLVFQLVFAQTVSVPYSFELDQKMGKLLYSPNTRLHTSSKTIVYDGLLLHRLDSIQSYGAIESKSWLLKKIFNEHLIQVEKIDHSFYVDFLPDMYYGKDMLSDNRKVWMNSRGIQAGLTIGDNFSFYTNFHESQAVFPTYLDQYIEENRIVPGFGRTKLQANNIKDWMYSTATLTYEFSPYLAATLAYDKNFIGDGYRSMLLSDFSSNYTHVKLRGILGNLQYTSILAYLNDPTNRRNNLTVGENQRLGDGVKYGTFQYLDWNVSNRFSAGFFHALVWSDRDSRIERPEQVDPTHTKGSNDNMFVGFTSKYKIEENWAGYGQFVFGGLNIKEMFSGNGYAGNKWAGQVGVRGHDVLNVKNLNLLAEFNTARPYMYMHRRPVSNYSNNSEALAHPQGGNFREFIVIVNYGWKRWNVQGKGVYVQKGLDINEQDNQGGDIFKSYWTSSNLYGNSIAQGLQSNSYYWDAKAEYVLNPKYNLRFEIGYTQRYSKVEENVRPREKSGVFTFGLRSSFRNIYHDF